MSIIFRQAATFAQRCMVGDLVGRSVTCPLLGRSATSRRFAVRAVRAARVRVAAVRAGKHPAFK